MRMSFRRFVPALPPNPLSEAFDVEKTGAQQNTTTTTITNNEQHVHYNIPPRLAKFQNLIGICSPNVLRAEPTLSRPAPNKGIYKRTVDEESRARFQYTVSNYVVNVCYMLQIIVGAALTALGAANGPSAAVTILGALNTIIAGLLTYLKGQGLPGRIDQYLHLLRTLREHIEEREREFLEPDCGLDVDEEIERVTKMYQEVRQTAKDNAPGTVLPPRGIITSLLKKPDINRSDVPAPRGDKTSGSILATGLQDLASLRHHTGSAGEREAHLTAAAGEGAKGGLQSVEAEMSHLGDMAKDTLGRLSAEMSHEKQRIPGGVGQ